MTAEKLLRIAVALAALTATPLLFGQTIPAEWHQPLSEQEREFARRIMGALTRAPDFPKLKGWYTPTGTRPEMQINAWEENMQITVPVEMFHFLRDDPQALAFLIAHEAGHAKQQEIYGQSCYTARNVKMSKFDWVRALADIAGGAATQGAGGAATALSNVQKQACEDNADAWAVKFMRQARIDPAGGIRFFSKLRQWNATPGLQHFVQQFMSIHSIEEVRIAHVTALILRKTGEEPRAGQTKVNPALPSRSVALVNAAITVPAGTEIVIALSESFSSKDAQTGQTVPAEVAQDVVANGKALIAHGSRATLSAGVVRASGTKVWLRISSVELKGQTYSVSSSWSDDVGGALDISLPAGTKLRFKLKSPLTIH